MASVKDKIPAARETDAKLDGKLMLGQADLERAGKNFEKFIQGTHQENERAREMHARLRTLGLEGITTREQFRDAVKGTSPSTEVGAHRFVELLRLAKDFASLTPPIEEIATPSPTPVDTSPATDEDGTMNATTDKDYIDAKLLAATNQMIGDIKAANAASDGRLATIDARMDGRIASIESKMDANFARFEATIQKSTADTVKWVAGIVMGLGVIGISLMTFLLNNVAPKAPSTSPAPAPIIIYAQPSPPAIAPQQPQVSKELRTNPQK